MKRQQQEKLEIKLPFCEMKCQNPSWKTLVVIIVLGLAVMVLFC